ATLLRPPDPATFPHVLDRIEAFFSEGTGEVHLWSAWPTPDLRPRGWRLVGYPPLLVRPPAATVPPPEHPAGRTVGIEDVRDPAGLADWERIAVEGYPLDDLIGAPPGSLAAPRLLSDARLRFAIGRESTEP